MAVGGGVALGGRWKMEGTRLKKLKKLKNKMKKVTPPQCFLVMLCVGKKNPLRKLFLFFKLVVVLMFSVYFLNIFFR